MTVFGKIQGQDQAGAVLSSALESGRVPHAYLFTGPEGVGKKTTALEWAKVLHCLNPISSIEACGACDACRKIAARNHSDVLWVDFDFQARLLKEPVEKQRSLKIDTLREMEKSLRLKPMESRVKTAFLSPAETLVEAAAHSLLKILEEPPPQTHMVLIAEDPGQILGTIRSRCQWVRFRPLSVDVLTQILRKERGDMPEDKIAVAALSAEGSLSRAFAFLDESDEISFDWEFSPLSELFSWCDGFRNPRLGREAADKFLRALLARFQVDLRAGTRRADDVRRVLDALHQLKQNVTPALVLQVLLLGFRRKAKVAAV